MSERQSTVDNWLSIVSLTKDELPWSVDLGKEDGEIYLIYRHFGSEGQKMETTLVVTHVLEEELDR